MMPDETRNMHIRQLAGRSDGAVLPRLARMAALAAVYFCGGKLGLKLAFLHANVTAIWPPTGIALAVLLLHGWRLWPGVWLGAFLVNVTTSGAVLGSAGIASGNTMEILAGFWLVERWANGRRFFERAPDIFKFIALAALLSTMLSATVGVTCLTVSGLAPTSQLIPIWVTWWLGDAVSAVILTPLIVTWSTETRPRWDRQRFWEGALILAVLLAIGVIGFGGANSSMVSRLPRFLFFPVLLWAAYRFGPRGAITTVCAIAGVALWGTLRGRGPFATTDPNESLVLLQAYMGTITITNLVLGAVMAERQRTDQIIREQEEQFAGLFNSAMDAIITVNADERVVLFNPAAEVMFGCPASAALGQSIAQFIPARFHGSQRVMMASLGTLNGVRANGDQFPVEASFAQMEIGERRLFTLILRDATERQKAAAELAAWQRELETRVAARTVELTMTHNQLRAEINECKRLEAEMARAVEREQLRLGQELHEGLGQQLAGISYQMMTLSAKVGKESKARAQDVKKLQGMILDCIEQARTLANGFYPIELERQGLLSALKEITSQPGLPGGTTFLVQADEDPATMELRGPVAIQLFRIAQEALQNIRQHAEATQVVIRLAVVKEQIKLQIADNGIGLSLAVDQSKGMGLRIMHYRAGLVGGKLHVRNGPTGGVSITCTVPLQETAAPVPAVLDTSAEGAEWKRAFVHRTGDGQLSAVPPN
jgi:PAS domain S-box-containing protein